MTLAPALAPLRSAPFRLLAAGQGLSWLGDALVTVALAVAIVQRGGTASDLGVVIGTGMATRMALMLLGGVWADRLRPQRLMVLCDVVRAATQLLLAVELAKGHPSTAALCALYVVTGAAGAFFRPSLASLQPLVVPEADRHAANAVMGLLQSGANIAGPALAGILVATAGAPVAFIANAATYVVSAVTVALVRVEATRAARRPLWHELVAGWSEVRSRDWYWKNLLGHSVWNTAWGVLAVLGPVVAIDRLGGATAVGVIGSSIGVGGVIGGFVAMAVRPRRPLLAANAGLALTGLFAAAYAWPAHHLWAVVASAVAAMLGLAFLNACWETVVQDQVPHGVLARVSSWDELTSFVGIPAGNAVAGPLAAAFGLGHTLAATAVVFVVSSFAPLLSGSVRRLDSAHARARVVEPDPA
ncbi:MAG TPA: MFS transporter [Oryzihumus sp.]|nr:MFS transporter [Oryzihumus sp.]